MLHGEADCKVKVGEQAWKMLQDDIEDIVFDVVNEDSSVIRNGVESIMQAIEDRLLSSINLGGF